MLFFDVVAAPVLVSAPVLVIALLLVIAPLAAGDAVEFAEAEGTWKRGVPEALGAADAVGCTDAERTEDTWVDT